LTKVLPILFEGVLKVTDWAETKPNKRDNQKRLTRQKLLLATIEIIAKEGLDGVTMSKVTKKTNLSRGMCNYHFETKEQLMIEAFQHIYREHLKAWQAALKDLSVGPEERLKKLITSLLTSPVAEPDKITVWLAFWSVRSTRKTYFELCADSDREYEREVENALRQIAGDAEMINGMSLQAISISLTAMIDGLYIQYVIAPGLLRPEDAINACMAYLSSYFPQFLSTT
jgi:TetR/AcrR family transcriptional repressor of bet genes